MIINAIKRRLQLRDSNLLWRKNNSNNMTAPMNMFDQSLVSVGDYTYGGIRVYNYSDESKLKIGSFCSIAENVMFVLGADHRLDTVSSYPYKVNITKSQRKEAISKGDIVVADDVWIGYNATIMSGVKIGQGAVVASGALVSKDVPPYAIVGGVPAHIIKYRFPQSLIDYLCTLDYTKLTEDLISNHIDELYASLDGYSIKDVEDLFRWFPKRLKGESNK